MKPQHSGTTVISLIWTAKGLSGVVVRNIELSLRKCSTGTGKTFRTAPNITLACLTCNFSPVCIALLPSINFSDPITQQQ